MGEKSQDRREARREAREAAQEAKPERRTARARRQAARLAHGLVRVALAIIATERGRLVLVGLVSALLGNQCGDAAGAAALELVPALELAADHAEHDTDTSEHASETD